MMAKLKMAGHMDRLVLCCPIRRDGKKVFVVPAV